MLYSSHSERMDIDTDSFCYKGFSYHILEACHADLCWYNGLQLVSVPERA